MVAPIVEELASEYNGKAVIVKCDVDSNDDIVADYKIRNIRKSLTLQLILDFFSKTLQHLLGKTSIITPLLIYRWNDK